ncbi:MAG: toll/interleukin-1 receptor domain-containing protein [Nitrospirales bacterium]|nr:toll/interleukin-1 receptor domain-containing protein [Nitrospirales bacterium]
MRTFISYTREKDKFEAVSQFRERLEVELHFYDSEAVIFQDREFIQGGDHFPDVLAEECRKADVLMIYLTPSWLQREWCRREFELFTNNMTDAARLKRVLPLLTVETPQVSRDSDDPIARHLAYIHHMDIRELRHLRYDDPVKLKYIAEVAERLYQLAQT